MFGGKPIDSGAYGCVFRPQLPCSKGTRRKGISKLMKTKYAKDEKAMIDTVRKQLSKIPNINKYVILDEVKLCSPGLLTPQDFQSFNHYCSYALEKEYSSLSQFNSDRDRYRLIQMPDGGQSLTTFIHENGEAICKGNSPSAIRVFDILNKKLVSLLKDVVIPMRSAKLIHMDVKPENILLKIDDKSLEVKLIDWGLAINLPSFADKYIYKPFQFNLPLGSILLSEKIAKLVSRELQRGTGLKTIAKMAMQQSLAINEGHYKIIINNLGRLFPTKDPVDIIIHNIAEIIQSFTLSVSGIKYFDHERYMHAVFMKNVDIVGFLTSYQELLLQCKYCTSLCTQLTGLVWNYLYSPKTAATPIDEKNVISYLLNLKNATGGARQKNSKCINDEIIISLKRGPKFKKYTAKIKSVKTGKIRTLHFGDKRYQQFQDTALGLYSDKNHGDKTRRKNYFTRHSGVSDKKKAIKLELKKSGNKWTPKLLSHEYLW